MDVAYQLVEKVKQYDPQVDGALILKAAEFAKKYHGTQLRASGDPYYFHPIQVAHILADLKLDSRTIITAILHDTVEDTEATVELIAAEFGDDIACGWRY